MTVKNADSLAGVYGASVRASGAGLLVTKFTGVDGTVSFTLKPTKVGYVTFRVSKSGYTTKSFTKKVFRP